MLFKNKNILFPHFINIFDIHPINEITIYYDNDKYHHLLNNICIFSFNILVHTILHTKTLIFIFKNFGTVCGLMFKKLHNKHFFNHI